MGTKGRPQGSFPDARIALQPRLFAAEYFRNPAAYITDLDVSDNRIGMVGARLLAEALTPSSTLKRLAVRGNMIGEDGCRSIADIIAKNSSITHLEYGAVLCVCVCVCVCCAVL